MTYVVNEIFYSLQGEGAQTGRPAVFCRLSGCNLWSGWEQDRATAICRFCDTNFLGTHETDGGRYRSAGELLDAIALKWPGNGGRATPFVICTGGEPLLQLDQDLIDALHNRGFEIAIETNGTRMPPAGIDWVCVSPKANSQLQLRRGNELKLVFPQTSAAPEMFEGLDFQYFFLQPLHDSNLAENTRMALQYCLEHPLWRLSLQTHKILDIR
jgi:7-carboxy-7-deazaguanine synthase (Cx14CxxC type)